jgi:hypothetical protein
MIAVNYRPLSAGICNDGLPNKTNTIIIEENIICVVLFAIFVNSSEW